MSKPVILGERTTYSSPWFELVAKLVRFPGAEVDQTFWGVRAADCVSVVALTSDGRVPLVRQYRPVVEQMTLELPSGHVEPEEQPEVTARRELEEETGCKVGEVHLLGRLIADSGRLEYSQWCYFASDAIAPTGSGWSMEPGVEVIYVTPVELREMIQRGDLNHAQHVAALALAIVRGWLA